MKVGRIVGCWALIFLCAAFVWIPVVTPVILVLGAVATVVIVARGLRGRTKS